jgi:hypothetical protein
VFLGRVVQEGEPLWLDEDRAWALALLELEKNACPECGQPWDVATSKDNEFNFHAELIRCHACTTSAKAVKAYQDRNKGSAEGLHVHIEHRKSDGG